MTFVVSSDRFAFSQLVAFELGVLLVCNTVACPSKVNQRRTFDEFSL
jgi:hypothetical protein